MLLPFRFALALAAAALSTGIAFAQTTPPAEMPGMSGGQNDAAAGKSPADSQMMSAMTKMNDAMSGAKMTGNPDRDFVSMMTPHHQSAVSMAQVELKYGKDPILRRMATDIVTSQKKEISEMQRWQAKHPAQ